MSAVVNNLFEAAAMSLLSRTLTTALGKYLTNVDVEGLDWTGIRLSKVELKATKIMDLPGMIKKKKKNKAGEEEEGDYDDDHEEGEVNKNGKVSGHDERRRSSSQSANHHRHDPPPRVIETTTTNDEKSISSEQLLHRNSSGWFSSWYNGSKANHNHDPLMLQDDSDLDRDRSSSGRYGEPTTQQQQQRHRRTTTNGSMAGFSTTRRPETTTTAAAAQTAAAGYSLHLCDGGRLGVLDVRLVGKALQVLVEDADITLRVIRAETIPGGTASASAGDAAAATKKTSASAPPAAKPKAGTTTTTTPGDRVMAENGLAKLLSMIPNVLLRDIRVRLMLNDDADADETAIDITIGLLSVTDGSIDTMLLSHFDGHHDNSKDDADDDDHDDDNDDVPESSSSDTSTTTGGPEPVFSPTENRFLTKRIRTGRGNEGGIVVRVIVPHQERLPTPGSGDRCCWARQGWYDAVPDACLVRVSGLDLQGKIFLGTAAEVAAQQNQYYYGDKDPVVDVDELLFSGVDAIVPGPMPSLPPASPLPLPAAAATVPEDASTSGNMSKYTTDDNGIQSCKLCSNFHRLARGLVPASCHCDLGPTECECWTNERFPPSQAIDCHVLDESLPMAGLVLSISIRDPLEINVDRTSLETLGTLVSLFTKPVAAEEKRPVDGCDESVDIANSILAMDDMDLMPSESMRSRYSVTSQGSGERRRGVRRHTSNDSLLRASHRRSTRRSTLAKAQQDQAVRNAFPKFMQPEKIQLIGLCIAQIRFRIHVMRPSELGDTGLSFCFWDCTAHRLAVDLQTLTATERPFQDVRLSLGLLRVVEYKGVHQLPTVLLGNHGANARDGDESTAATTATTQTDGDPVWPSTAAVLCNVPALFDPQAPGTAGLQVRYRAVVRPETHFDFHHKSVVAHLGHVVADSSLSIKDQIMFVMTEARDCVLGQPVNAAAATSRELEARRLESQLFYKATVQSADLTMVPLIKTSVPQLSLNGEISTRSGFSLETMLADIGLKHGISSRPRALARGLTLQQLAELPETVRLRVLLFVHNLGPLEKALGLEPARNSFLQCRAVNKGIVSFAQELQRKATISTTGTEYQTKTTSERRQAMLNELMQLGDDELEALLATRRGQYSI